MRKIEHIGIAVKSLKTSNLLFEKLLGQAPYKHEEVISEGVKTSFFMNGPNKIELLEATTKESSIAKFIEKKGPNFHKNEPKFQKNGLKFQKKRTKNSKKKKPKFQMNGPKLE